MDMSDMSSSLEQVSIDQFGVNKILCNLILQMFLKNNVDEPDDIVNTIAQYLELPIDCPIVEGIANELNISLINGIWVWVIN